MQKFIFNLNKISLKIKNSSNNFIKCFKRKRFIFIIIFTFLIFLLFIIFNEDLLASEKIEESYKIVTINKIRIIINEEIYDWENLHIFPKKRPTNYTDPLTIISFLSIKPKQTIKLNILEQKIFNIEKILISSALFSSVCIDIIELSQDNNLVNIIVEVKEGFLYKFGGGSIYGIFGKNNLSGLRKSFTITLGYNLNGINYTDQLLFNTNFFLDFSLYYKNSFGFKEISFNRIDLNLSLGYRITPFFEIILNSLVKFQNSNLINELSNFFIQGSFYSIEETLSFNYIYYFFINKNKKNDFYFRGYLKFYPSLIYFYNLKFEDSFQFINYNIGPIYSINIKNSFLFESKYFSIGFISQLSTSTYKLDYFNSKNMSLSEEPFVRSPVDINLTFPDNFFITSFEIRSPFIKLFNINFLAFELSVFSFYDIAICKILYKYSNSFNLYLNNPYYLHAFGIGIRFGFAQPVNTYFTLTFGINKDNNWKLIFYSGKGF
ncbi:MAG: hypothetical protein N3A58_08770 [Spirochaetes bacterium]|nr:hypothetical protein [Spirochaetota bacterium]